MTTLRYGYSGPEVVQLQENLNAVGNDIPVTGLFDDATLAAVKTFQTLRFRGSGLPVTGVYDALTDTLLLKAVVNPAPLTVPTAGGDRSDSVMIPSGADTVTVSFSPPYPGAPQVPQGSVLKADPADANIFVVGVQNLTAQGCVFLLNSATSNGNYRLSYRTTL